jgi:Alr-MurF fusion protein
LKYSISHIASILHVSAAGFTEMDIEHLEVDSRKMVSPINTLFFAMVTQRRNGHQFIADLYKKGVRNFVVSEPQQTENFPNANFILVKDTLMALQQLAAHHRSRFTKPTSEKPFPVIGITGSNGKTIVKEWLYQLLHQDYNIIRSPKSYNSQIGVPLSVWQMNEQHTLAIFEAGISKLGEMENLEKIIQPTIGILTNIGEAHSEGFSNKEEKETEKRKLFKNAIVPRPLSVLEISKQQSSTIIVAFIDHHDPHPIEIEIPFTDDASIENAITCWRIMLWLQVPQQVIKTRMLLLQPVNMRLELKKAVNNCTIINDSYSADLSSLEIALNFLALQSPQGKRTVILSDFLQSADSFSEMYTAIAQTLQRHHINRLIGIGTSISKAFSSSITNAFSGEVLLFTDTAHCLEQFRASWCRDETILIKGARVFAFEKIVNILEEKVHQTVLEINLNAIADNLKEYQKILKPNTKVMAMVKAFAYGSGGAEVAGILQYHKADYLGVAYADEGVALRKAGISLPIMVMNPEPTAFEAIVEYNLEPEMYSLELMQHFEKYLSIQGLEQYPVHIELETGMNRLGFSINEVSQLAAHLQGSKFLKVVSVFSHLAASEDPTQDQYTQQQFAAFSNAVNILKESLPYAFLSHIANSAAAIRHPQMQLDMVRLGIGLYGVDSAATGKLSLQAVTNLKSTVAQIKHLKKGESVSYNRRGIVNDDTTIATVRLGYADGYPRRLGNGSAKVYINGSFAPTIGTVCMDMFMIDITAAGNVAVGDRVELFGTNLPVQQVAAWAGTIPYEIMTGISQRVKRVYFEE